MKVKALAVKKEQFKDRNNGQISTLWKVFVLADDGDVGAIYSADPVVPGNEIELVTAVKDGRLKLKVSRQIHG